MNSAYNPILYEEFEDTKSVNQNPYIEEEQTTKQPKEKVKKDKQRSTKHTHKTKDRVYKGQLLIKGTLSGSVECALCTRLTVYKSRISFILNIEPYL